MSRTTAPTTLAVKVDVCTYAGLKNGVPALLRLFDEIDLRASFFVTFGPDHSGRAIRRIFRRGFLTKMLRRAHEGDGGRVFGHFIRWWAESLAG